MLETLSAIIGDINGIVWGPVMLILLGGTGLYLMGGLTLMPIMKLAVAVRMMFEGRVERGKGDITPFNALMTSLSATVGTGNIVGVASAIALGGPGALFWMWCIALVGMATNYAEALLAVHYRIEDKHGNHHGGPMYYILNGLGQHWRWLAVVFAVMGMFAGFGIGNTIQSNAMAGALQDLAGVPPLWTGLGVASVVALVLIGGIKSIAKVAGKLVPGMAILYILGGLTVLAIHADKIPGVLEQIFHYAFTPHAAVGGFAGSTMMMALRYGVARGVFSNEAGLGSTPIAHASASARHPVEQGMVAMLGVFIDTILICSMTGFVILLSGLWQEGNSGLLAGRAYEMMLPGIGQNIVYVGLAIFAFTTILGWSLYSEKCAIFLFGNKAVIPFRIAWVVLVPVGAVMNLGLVWTIADTLNGLMALPNLIALLLLSPVVFQMSRKYFKD